MILKIGGKVLSGSMDYVIKDLASNIVRLYNNILVVHGGGDLVTEYSRKLGVEPKFVISPSGIRSRYTSREELEVFIMVMAGKINKELVSMLAKHGVKSIGLTGADAAIAKAERKKRIIIIDERGRKRVIEGGYTGKIIDVNDKLLKLFMDLGYVVILAPIAIDSDGTLLNVDADQMTYALAKKLRPTDVVILTDVEGVKVNGKLLRRIYLNQLDDVIGKVGLGMNRKLLMVKEMLLSGVKRVIISTGLVVNPISKALEGLGTIIEAR